jgi:hypothetical protein
MPTFANIPKDSLIFSVKNFEKINFPQLWDESATQ